MNSTENNLLIEQFKEIISEVQSNLHFFTKEGKASVSQEISFEIPMTNNASIFLDKNITSFEKIKGKILERKRMIFHGDRNVLADFPNLFVSQAETPVENIVLKEEKKTMKKENKNEEVANFFALEPRHKLERVILPKKVKEEVLMSLTLIENQVKIYDEWGFSEVDAKPKLILNFYGPPGTGKTMVSHAISHQLGKKILAVNYAEIESKYVGDAPKNLFKAFEVAKQEKAVLFFDEADSFLGKRIESVSSSSDQAINSLRSQMLILLEDFEGVVVFATNLVKNYDKAFESRILKHIHFDLPDEENRTEIIKLTIPSKVPFSENVNKEELYKELAKLSEGFSGREIKNAVLESLTYAVQHNIEFLDLAIFEKGFNNTKEKLERLEQERNKNKIDPELKKKLEKKIQDNLEKRELEQKEILNQTENQ